MARRRPSPPPGRATDPLLSLGLFLLTGSAVAGAISFLLGGLPVLAAVGAGVRSVLWVTGWLGVALIALHLVLRWKTVKQVPAVSPPIEAPHRADTTSAMPVDAVWRSGGDWGRQPGRIEPTFIGTEIKNGRWSAAVFAQIEWRRFEAVVEALFEQAGYRTQSQTHGADGGVDIWLYSPTVEGSVAVVQCKHWQGKPVGVKELREFLGVITAQRVQNGTYATSSRFTTEALAFAQANGIRALDGEGLLNLIGQRTPEQQAQLLAVAYEGEYWKPTCASCGIKLVERQPRQGGNRFWGCRNYPRCKSTLPMRSG